MDTELFGVLDDGSAFDSLAGEREFDRVVEGEAVTVGVRDDALGQPGRTSIETTDAGVAVVWGEAFVPTHFDGSAAAWLLDAFQTHGIDAFDGLNGSYLAVVEHDDRVAITSDPIRSWECFTASAAVVEAAVDGDGNESIDGRVFGSDAASVARTIESPTIDPQGIAEFLYLGGTLNHRTPIRELDRLLLDHALTRDGSVQLDRYRHRAATGPAGRDGDRDHDRDRDHAEVLARRLERAINRRNTASEAVDGRSHAALLSAGFDSRLLLACRDDVDTTYTVGPTGSDEVAVAGQLAARYGAEHVHLPTDGRYLDRDETAIRATNGVKESLHVHHAGYTDAIDADAISHGLLLDTLLRGYFLPRETTEVAGLTIPRGPLDANPDPLTHLTGIMGYLPATADLIPRTPGLDAGSDEAFLDDSIGAAYRECADRATDEYAAFERFGVQNVLATPFRTHLADQYTESLVAADAGLVDWHLQTPPAVRTEATFRDALRRIDADILDPRPPDRPHDSFFANQVEKRLRQSIPGLEPFDAPWPDRRTAYADQNLDGRILLDRPDLHGYPPRFKLRIRDLRQWLRLATDGTVSVDEALPVPE